MRTPINRIAVLSALQDIYWHIRQKVVADEVNIDFSKIGNFSTKEGRLDEQEIERAIFYLRGSGCEWSLKKKGGCANCGHYAGTSRGVKISSDYFVKQFEDMLKQIDVSKYPMICVYNAGSFLNDQELPTDARRSILKIIAQSDHIRSVIFESRPEYITKESIKEIENILKDKRVEVGVGLEIADDFLREICINKGFLFSQYKTCADLISESSLHLLTYIIIKPLFLSVQESINQAVETAKKAYECGTDVISLEPISMQHGTLTEYFYDRGEYSLPTGWDIVEVIKEIDYLPVEIRIGGFEYFPEPEIVVSNCPHCRQTLNDAIRDYNSKRDMKLLLSLQCGCKSDWERRRKREASIEVDITNRVAMILKKCDYKL